MSQDQHQHLFSVRRPRETLGPVSHNASAIPMPASAMKRSTSQQAPATATHARTTSASRLSLAPNRPAQPVFHRSSSGGNLADMPAFSTVKRPSTANFLHSAGGRQSYAPVTSTPANPLQLQDSTARRSSVYSARPSSGFGPAAHQSFFATAPPQAGIPQDPRRLRDPNTRATMGQELMDFLAHRNFEMEMKHTLTHKTMISPTQKDFNMMFHFLYHCIDPSYRFQKNIDAEVPPLLKQLRYPFEKNISKSQLAAVGGNNWSTFLGLLHWMMNLAKMMEQYSTGVYDSACEEAGFDVGADRITFEFLSDAYKEWLSIEDDDDDEAEAQRKIQPHIDAMAAKFAAANQANLDQVRQLEAESQALQAQIDELSQSAPKLAKLDETIKVLEEDRVKFESYNESMESKVARYLHRADLLQAELATADTNLQTATADRTALQSRLDDQGLSTQALDRLTTERARLQKSLQTTATRLDESRARCGEKETEAATKLDELESLIDTHNRRAASLGLPASASDTTQDSTTDLELHLTVPSSPPDRLLHDPTTGHTPPTLLPPQTLQATKSQLQTLRHRLHDRRNAALEADMAAQDLLAKTTEALEDKHAELESLGARRRAAEEEFEGLREVGRAGEMVGEAQVERMERELGRLRGWLGVEGGEWGEGREMGVNLEYEQLTLHAAALREDLHTQLERVLNDVIKFKIHVQSSLEGYEEFVAGEVEREVVEAQQLQQQEGSREDRGEGEDEGDGESMQVDDGEE